MTQNDLILADVPISVKVLHGGLGIKENLSVQMQVFCREDGSSSLTHGCSGGERKLRPLV